MTTSQTYLPGKDLSLEETVDNSWGYLGELGIAAEAVGWLNPAPNCWSVHLRAIDCHHLCTNGKGSTRLACLASGLGEFFERLATNFFFADYFLDEGGERGQFLFYPDERWFHPGRKGSIPVRDRQGHELLDQGLRRFYDPEQELTFDQLCDHNSNSPERGICALPFQALGGRRTTYFPVSLLNNLYVSNGMAAGNSPAECCAQALSEIIERHVKNLVIAQGISLPDIPAEILERYPRLAAILDSLAAHGLEVRVKDGSLGGQFPVIAALLTDTASGGVFAAFGANCRLETAIERTLTEMLQGRNLDRLRHFQPPSHDRHLVADPYNLESHFVDSDGLLLWDMFRDRPDFSFTPWDFSGSTEQEFARLRSLITAKGLTIYRAEYRHCRMYSCRMIVPGMSEIYPVEDLIWNNRVTGARLRRHLLRIPEMSMQELARLYELLEELELGDHLLVSQLVGVLFDEASAWASLRIGELKVWLLLAMKRREEALHWCTWTLDHGALPEPRMRLFRLLQTLLNFERTGAEPADYGTSLALLYRPEELAEATKLGQGLSRCGGLEFGPSWSAISTEHSRLLAVYQRLNRLKNGLGG